MALVNIGASNVEVAAGKRPPGPTIIPACPVVYGIVHGADYHLQWKTGRTGLILQTKTVI
jgi:hypothetical protein